MGIRTTPAGTFCTCRWLVDKVVRVTPDIFDIENKKGTVDQQEQRLCHVARALL